MKVTFGRKARHTAKASLRQVFELGQRVGLDVLPRHFYSSIPNIRDLRATTEWRKPMSMVGIAGVRIEDQLAFTRGACPAQVRTRLQGANIWERACNESGGVGYGPAEAEFLYCFVGSKRPKRIVQVGAGVSTAVILRAAAEFSIETEIVCVDPYPTKTLQRLAREGRVRLITEPAQKVALAMLTELGEEAMLFVDSTHAVKPGSEVNRIVLEVLPRLPIGTWVHFHDVYFPYDYPRALLTEPFFPTESTLLHAFLVHNERYTLRVALSMLHYAASQELAALLPIYRPAANDEGLAVPEDTGHFPSSIYLEVTRQERGGD